MTKLFGLVESSQVHRHPTRYNLKMFEINLTKNFWNDLIWHIEIAIAGHSNKMKKLDRNARTARLSRFVSPAIAFRTSRLSSLNAPGKNPNQPTARQARETSQNYEWMGVSVRVNASKPVIWRITEDRCTVETKVRQSRRQPYYHRTNSQKARLFVCKHILWTNSVGPAPCALNLYSLDSYYFWSFFNNASFFKRGLLSRHRRLESGAPFEALCHNSTLCFGFIFFNGKYRYQSN